MVRPPELTDEHYATGDLAVCSDGVLCMNIHGIANESLRQHIRCAHTQLPLHQLIPLERPDPLSS